MHFFLYCKFSLFSELMQMRHDLGEATGVHKVAKNVLKLPLPCQPPLKGVFDAQSV